MPGTVLHRGGDDAADDRVGRGRRRRSGLARPVPGDRLARCRGRPAGLYLETGVPPDEDLGKGEYYWHEVIGMTVRGTDGADLGGVQDIYRIGDTEVFEVGGGPSRHSTCPPCVPSSGSSRRSAGRSSWTPRRSTCDRPRSKRPIPPDRRPPRRTRGSRPPRRRRSDRRRRAPAEAPAEAAPTIHRAAMTLGSTS